MNSTKPVREGFHTVTAYLYTRGAAEAIEFYKQAFGATELARHAAPDDNSKLMHAEIKIGDSPIMLADECLERGIRGPRSLGGSPLCFMVYVDDADRLFKQAVAAGAKVLEPMQDKPYGRSGGVEDPFGFVWYLCSQPR